MKIKISFSLLLVNILLFAFTYQSIGQDIFGFRTESYAFHPKYGILHNIHIADFAPLIDGDKCGYFESGSGTHNSIFLLIEKPISNVTHLGVGLGYTNRSGDLKKEYAYTWYNNEKMQNVDVNTEYVYTTKITYYEIQTEVRTVLIDKLINGPFRFMAALRLLIPANSFEFDYYKEIVSPDDAVFIDYDGSQVKKKTLQTGNLARQVGMGYGLSVGVENMLRISSNVLFTQQLVFDYNLTHFTEDRFWYGLGVRLEAGLRLGFGKTSRYIDDDEAEEERIYKEPELLQPPVIAKKLSKATIIAIESSDLRVRHGDELLATLPVVNSIFFAKNSDRLPYRYSTDPTAKVPRFYGDAIEKHHLILPELKSIINQNPNASIVLTGYKSKHEIDNNLPKNRANEIANELIKLGIDKNKFTIKHKLSPPLPSNEEFEAGAVENQRVDIALNHAQYQEYVSFKRFRELNGKVSVNINFENIDPADKVVISTNFSEQKITCEKPGVYSFDIKQRLDDDQTAFDYEVYLAYGDDRLTEHKSIEIDPLPHRRVDLELSNFEAILRFDYNSSILIDENKELIRQLTELIPAGTKIVIFGTADKLGTDERNTVLSSKRSINTQDYIKSISSDKFILAPHSARIGKFDETSQQGRFLNRSITVTLEK